MQTDSSTPPSRWPWGLAFVLVIFGLAVIAVRSRNLDADNQAVEKREPSIEIPPAEIAKMPDSATQQQIETFCSNCHRLPAADQFPRSAWEHEVKRGFQFYRDSGRSDLQLPPLAAVTAYFEAQAPEVTRVSIPERTPRSSPVKFRQAEFAKDDVLPNLWQSAISSVNWIKRTADGPGELFCSDMRLGRILKVELDRKQLRATQFATVPHPTVVRVADLDGNGQSELVVADLGSYQPQDHELGAVWWYRDLSATSPEPERIPIFGGVGRIADVQVFDADADGDQDLVVAEFGWHKTGGIHLLENQGMEQAKPKFQPHLLDHRSGTIHVPVADIDGDGRLDFVALISQEHETAVAFLNRGNLKFEAKELAEPQDPSIGSSGLSLVDLDGDRDLDVLQTCGDTFDSYSIKPNHGVQWLENTGDMQFTRHVLAELPGAHRALAGDMDGDGDLDVVAAAFLPRQLRKQPSTADLDSLILLRQTKPGTFERSRLQGTLTHHMAVEMADFDLDGDLDLAVGNFAEQQLDDLAPLTIWWNLTVDK